MIIEYEQEYLEQLYNNGKCNNKSTVSILL